MGKSHPPYARLTEYAESHLGTPDWATVEQHVVACGRCSEDVRSLRSTIALMQSDSVESVPERVVEPVLHMFRQHFAARNSQQPVSLGRRLLGILRFDSATSLTQGFGVRAGGMRAARQLLFSAEPYELDVRADPRGAGWGVSGQVLGPLESSAGEVELFDHGSSVQCRLNELLEFSLPTVAAGSYRLDVRLDSGTVIHVPSLSLGA